MRKRTNYIDELPIELLPSRAVPEYHRFYIGEKGGEAMPPKKIPCQVWMPRRMNLAIKAACRQMSEALGEHYSRARFLREAAVNFLSIIERNVKRQRKKRA
jgi:hypothetical protein